MNSGGRTVKRAYHFKPLDKGAEVGVLLEVGDESGLNSFPGTFNIYSRPVHLSKVHPLQVSQTPKQNLQEKQFNPNHM